MSWKYSNEVGPYKHIVNCKRNAMQLCSSGVFYIIILKADIQFENVFKLCTSFFFTQQQVDFVKKV